MPTPRIPGGPGARCSGSYEQSSYLRIGRPNRAKQCCPVCGKVQMFDLPDDYDKPSTGIRQHRRGRMEEVARC